MATGEPALLPMTRMRKTAAQVDQQAQYAAGTGPALCADAPMHPGLARLATAAGLNEGLPDVLLGAGAENRGVCEVQSAGRRTMGWMWRSIWSRVSSRMARATSAAGSAPWSITVPSGMG